MGGRDALRRYTTGLLTGGAGDSDMSAAAMAAYADAQGITGLLLASPVFAQPELAAQRAALQDVAKRTAVQEMAGASETRRVLSLLADAGIDVLVLKGAALAYWLYREPWHRPRSDLDLLVRDRTVAWTAVGILRESGYGFPSGMDPDVAHGFEVVLQRQKGLVVDLHWRLLNTAVLERSFSYAELAAQAVPLPALHAHARGLDRLHALFHALLHRVTNLAKGDGDRLIWLYDIHLLVDGLDSEAWQELVRLCMEKGISTLCLDGLRASTRALGTAIPQEVEAELSRLAATESWQLDGLDQGAVDRSHLAALPWPGKIAWLRRKLFPSPDFMRFRYGAAGRWSLAVAYVLRWLTGLRRAFGRRLG